MPVRSRARNSKRRFVVIQCEREHAAQASDDLFAPLFPAVDDDFDVAMRLESMSFCDQFFAQRLEIVDFAIEGDPDRIVFIRQRLVSRKWVDDSETARRERDAGTVPDTLPVRPAMGEPR